VLRIDPRIAVVGFLLNVASFLAWTVIAVWSRYEAQAEDWQQGMLPLFSGITYIVVSLKAGALSDRMSRVGMARLGMVLFAAFCGLAWWSRGVLAIAGLAVINGFGMALIWPAIQARIADEASADDLERRMGEFSLSWSAGKTTGFFAFTLVYRDLGFGIDALLLCGAFALVVMLLLPRPTGRRGPAKVPLVRDDLHPPALRAAHLRFGWMANFASYGLGSTLVYLYPDLLASAARPPEHQGIILGTLYASQTAGFWLFGRFSGWRYRLAPILAWMAAGCGALLELGSGAPLLYGVPAAAILGLALAQAYSASVYYSVHSEESRGARAGVHEALIGASDFAYPLLGGLAATATGWSLAPYATAVSISVAALGIGALSVRRRAR
jgi:MFS family permease